MAVDDESVYTCKWTRDTFSKSPRKGGYASSECTKTIVQPPRLPQPPQHDASKCLQNNGQRLKFDANCRDCKDKKASGKAPVGCSDGYRLVVEKDPTKQGCRATLCYPPTPKAAQTAHDMSG